MILKKVFIVFIGLSFLTSSSSLRSQSNKEDFVNQKVKNLTAFGKTYGYIRLFYPNTQTQKFDWEAFLVYGIKKVKNLKSDLELKDTLSNLFSSIAPHVVFSENENNTCNIKPIFQGDSITFWQHSSMSIGESIPAKKDGIDLKILVTTPFDSTKVIKKNNPLLKSEVQFDYIDYYNINTLFYPENFRYAYDSKINNKYIIRKQPNALQHFSSELINDLWVTIPIALNYEEAEHLQYKIEIENFSKELENFYNNKEALDIEDISYADFILVWNTVHHLYDYRKSSEKKFDFQSDEQLLSGLKMIYTSDNKKDTSYKAVNNYISLFKDGHGNVLRLLTVSTENKNDDKQKRTKSWLPFYKIHSNEKIYVLKSFDPKVKEGDEILEIDNKDVSVLISDIMNSLPSSTQINLSTSLHMLGSLFNRSKATVKVKRDNKILKLELNTISQKEYYKYRTNPFEHKSLEYPTPKTIYINPSLASSKDIKEKFDEIVKAEHLIIDLRSYPKLSVYDIVDHIPVPGNLRKGLILSNTLNMYPNQEQHYYIWRSLLSTVKRPYIKAQISVLMGGDTMSRGETVVSYFKQSGATLIGDNNTGGAAGGMNWITTPGKIRVFLTTSYTVRQNGEEMQSIGIAPDILVKYSKENLKTGKDLLYEAALQQIKNFNQLNIDKK